MHIPRVFLSAMVLVAFQTGAAQQREPIRVGSNVQATKLIHRIEPVFPAQAKAARVSGQVILQATINEKGEVSDLRVLRGHPLLDDAALEAVRQWRYTPTYLNGEPVAVMATVTVVFGNAVTLQMDERGTLKEAISGLEGEALLEKIKAAKEPVFVNPNPAAPFRLIEQSLQTLAESGIGDIQVRGPYVFREQRLFYLPGLADLRPPELALDYGRLKALAAQEVQPVSAATGEKVMLLYQLFVNEVGEIVGVQHLRGPRLSAVESELQRTPVVAPARRGAEVVPMAITVPIAIE